MKDYNLLKVARLEKLLRKEELDRLRMIKLGKSSYKGLIEVSFEFIIVKSVIDCCYSYVPENIYVQLFELMG